MTSVVNARYLIYSIKISLPLSFGLRQKFIDSYYHFSDGRIKLFDALPLIEKGVFRILQDKNFFLNRCTVLNHTLAWDITGDYNPFECIDLDPIILYEESVEVPEPFSKRL